MAATLLGSAVQAAEAAEPALRPPAPVIGEPGADWIEPGDTLLDVAYRHRLGFERVTRANPAIDPWIPDAGTVVQLPTQHVLPDAPHVGLVVNVPELQLYDFNVSAELPEVFALAIGDEMDPSLIGEFRVGRKRVHPEWRPPASIRAEKPDLPDVVPPGPENPLGDYWLTIGSTTYGIHGTNNRWSIGREATHGCLRLYNDQIERLFKRTREGTRVHLVYQTVKIGERGGMLYLEAHPDRYLRDLDRVDGALERLRELGVTDPAAIQRARDAIASAQGVPVPIAPRVATSTPTS
jgi:L,D-transpeptidase ErfK/SrfK